MSIVPTPKDIEKKAWPSALTINSGSGDITLTDIHGDTTAATSDLDIDGATISVQNIGASGARDEINAVNINGTTAVTLNKPIYTEIKRLEINAKQIIKYPKIAEDLFSKKKPKSQII